MGRFFLTLVVGLALFLGVAWYFNLFVPSPEHHGAVDTEKERVAALGELLYPAKPLLPEPKFVGEKPADPVVVQAVWVALAQNKPEVSAEVDGKVLFVGEPVPDELLALAGVAPFAAEPFGHALVNQGRTDITIVYRRLRESEKVESQQVLAVLDPAKALNDVAVKDAVVKVAETEYDGAYKTYKEAEQRYLTARKLYERRPPLIGEEEFREKKLARDKFESEAEGKKAAIEKARREADTAAITLKQHFVRNPIDGGFIKTIYKDRGASVSQKEPILQMYTTDHLRAEGVVDVQYWNRLREGMPAIIEPAVENDPFRTLEAHRAEVTGVAVSKDAKLFVSVSEDHKGYVWVKELPAPKCVLPHDDAVRSVACTPPGSDRNWCITGCSNGSIYFWDLDNPEKAPLKPILDAHRDAVTAIAFSPDGKYFATGSSDNMILVWKTGDDKFLYPIEDHAPAGPISSLFFTPQSRLVSASLDNTLRVWELHENGAKVLGEPIGGRSGHVNYLGVSPDGRWMLFDQGKTLQFLSVTDGRYTAALQNDIGGTSFETLAIFSPDSSLMLTASAAEGRLQIWRTPSSYRRGYEVRELVAKDKSAVTCAAFAPDAGLAAAGVASFAISGSRDGKVYLWAVPGKLEVENHRIKNARLTFLGRTVEGGTNHVRLGVEVQNRDRRLMDGSPATIVIEP